MSTQLAPTTPQSPTAPPSHGTALEVRVVTGAGGGPEKTILNTPRFMREHGYETLCAYMHPPGDAGFETLRRRAAEWDAPLISIPDRGIRDIKVIRRLAQLCREHAITIWHGHDYKSNLLGLLLRPYHRMKLVTTVHGWVNQEGKMPLYTKLDKRCLKYYQHVICVSEDLYQECRQLKVPEQRLSLIGNAIDETQFCRSDDKDTAKRQLGLPTDRLVIGAVGRLAEEKGFHHLIESFAQLIAAGHNVTLAIAGDGTQRETLSAQAAASGVAEYIHFLGFQEDTRRLYEAFDVFCLSSLREGLPNVLLEALSCEVPSVATDLPGVRQVIDRPGEQAIIVPSADPQALTTALTELITTPTKRQKLTQAARTRIETHFSFKTRIAKIAKIYNQLPQ